MDSIEIHAISSRANESTRQSLSLRIPDASKHAVGELLREKQGITVGEITWLPHSIAAVTNDVGFSSLRKEGGPEVPVMVKMGTPGVEPREIVESVGDKYIGGWLAHRLENEALLMKLLDSHSVPIPHLIRYHRESGGTEVIVEERIPGETCYNLRPTRNSDVTSEEFQEMEKQKGEILARIQTIPLADASFGPLDPESQKFPSWREYFNYKMTTTLSLLYASYNQLQKLEHFSELARSETAWQRMLERVATLYSSDTVQQLLENDGIPTVAHGDYWDGNLMGHKDEEGAWKINVIDLERGDISGRTFDLALNIGWKVGGGTEDPLEKSAAFLQGFSEADGKVPEDVRKYVSVYCLWQYLDFLLIDDIYSIDRTDESVGEIYKHVSYMQEWVEGNRSHLALETFRLEDVALYKAWVEGQRISSPEANTTEQTSIQEAFGKTEGIVIAGVKLPPVENFADVLPEEMYPQLIANIEALCDAGVDGIVLDAKSMPRVAVYRDEKALQYFSDLAKLAKKYAGDVKIGINMLLFDPAAALTVARATGLDFVFTDVYADSVLCLASESERDHDFNFMPQPELVSRLREDIGAKNILLFAGVDSKFFPQLGNRTLRESARIAQTYGADALIVGNFNGIKKDDVRDTNLPIIAMGGVREGDLPTIQANGYAGYSAASMFESTSGVIDVQKTKKIMKREEGL